MINQLFKANHIFKQMLFQLIEFVIITSFDLMKANKTRWKQTKQKTKYHILQRNTFITSTYFTQEQNCNKKSKIYTVKIVSAKVYTVSIFVEFAGTSHQRINILRELSLLAKELRSASLLLKRIVNPFAKAISSKYIANLWN